MKINKKMILPLVLAFTMICIFCLIFYIIFNSGNKYDIITLNSGWDVSINGSTYTNTDLDTLKFAPPNIGDVVTITTTLPNIDMKNATLRFIKYHTVVDAYLGDELIYTYGNKLYDQKKLLGSFYHNVLLPIDFKNQLLTINFVITQENSFTCMESITLAQSQDHIYSMIQNNKVPIFVFSFFVVFGVILMIFSAVIIPIDKAYINLFLLATSSFLIGIWLLCNYNLIELFSNNYELNTLIEYISMYSIPIPLVFYFYNLSIAKKSKIINNIFKYLLTVNILFLIITSVLHFTNFVHYPEFLNINLFFILVDIVFIISTTIINIKKQDIINKMILFGFSGFALVIIGDIIRFQVLAFFNISAINTVFSLIPLGFMIFFICTITSYFIHYYKGVQDTLKREILVKLAYKDFLTELYNRTKCEEVMRDYNNSDTPYTLILFDLNHLKHTNDTFGHLLGDTYIKNFAKILSKCFGNYGTIGRMGGDEFLFITKTTDSSKILDLLNNYNNLIEEENQNSSLIDYSAAYGYATSGEISENSPSKVYSLADKRMYNMKKIMKNL